MNRPHTQISASDARSRQSEDPALELNDSIRNARLKLDNLEGKNLDLQHSNEELLCIIEEIRMEKSRVEGDNAKLRDEKARLSHTLDQLGGGAIVLDSALKIKSFTPLSTLTLHILDTDIGRPFDNLVTKLDLSSDDIVDIAKTVQESGEAHSVLTNTSDGSRCLLRVAKVSDGDGVIITLTEAGDIGSEQEMRFDGICRALVEASCDVLLEMDNTGEIGSPVHEWEEVTGQRWPDYRGLGWLEMVDEEYREEVMEGWHKSAGKRNLAVLEFPLWSAEHREYRRCSLRAVPQERTGGRWLAAITDVEAVEGSFIDGGGHSSLLESVFDNSDTGVLVTGIDGEILLTNDLAASLFEDKRKGDIVGLTIWEMMPSDAARTWREMDDAVMEDLEQRTLESGNPFRSPGSTDRTYFTIKFPLLSAGGTTPHGVGTIITDVTTQKAGEQRERERTREVEAINRELAAKNRDLDEFAHMVSHDLKQPLRIIENYACMLEEECGDVLSADASAFLSRMESASRRASELVEATLTYARLGREALDIRPVDLSRLVTEVITDFDDTISAFDISIDVGELPTTHCDPDMVFHIFSNIIGNAIKYRKEDVPLKLDIRCEVRAMTPTFLIRDNGIGIDPNFTQRVFEPFQRLHAQEKIPGTGIGLAITRKIVERHGGEIELAAAENGGTVVSFTLKKRDALVGQ